jgi:hypothetical protein
MRRGGQPEDPFSRRRLALIVAIASAGIGLLRLSEGLIVRQPALVAIGLIVLAGSLLLLAAALWWPGWE